MVNVNKIMYVARGRIWIEYLFCYNYRFFFDIFRFWYIDSISPSVFRVLILKCYFDVHTNYSREAPSVGSC